MKLVIDALGSDMGPQMVATGVKKAMQRFDFDAVIAGPKHLMDEELKEYSERIEWLDTSEMVSNTEHPVRAIRRKKNASIVLGLQRLNDIENEVAFLTAGSTGALLAGGYFITGRYEGIERACIAAFIPNPKGGTVLVDTGANMDTTPQILNQFAVLASTYVKQAFQIELPRVGLLNIGKEAAKGDRRSQETYALLEQSDLNFIGNVEARDILSGECDVLVSDGFSANIALKSLEGTAITLFSELKKGIYSSLRAKIGGYLLKPILKKINCDYSYKAHGCAPLLGVKKPLFKAHGSSDSDTFALAIEEVLDYLNKKTDEKMKEIMEDYYAGNQRN